MTAGDDEADRREGGDEGVVDGTDRGEDGTVGVDDGIHGSDGGADGTDGESDGADRDAEDTHRWRHVRRIARTELLRTRRGVGGDARSRAMAAVAAVLLGGGLVVTLGEAHAIGRAVRTGTDFGLVGLFRRHVVSTALLFTGLFALRTVARIGRPDNVTLLATTVSVRSVVGGLLVAEYVRNAAVFGGVALLHALAFGVGVGAPAVVVPATVAALLLLAATMVLGYVVGVGARIAAVRSTATERSVTVGIVAAVALVVTVAGGAVGATPLGLYGDLFLAGTPLVPGIAGESLTVALGVLTAVPLLGAAAVRLAPMLWFAETGASDRSGAVGSARPPSLAGGPTGHVVWIQWVRGIRAPIRFAHAVYLGLLLGPTALIAYVLPGLAAPILPGLTVFTGVWIAGGALCLNPIDDEGDALPVVLLADIGSTTLVRGRLVAGLLPGLAVVALALVTPVVLGADPVAVAVTVALGVVLSGAAAGAGVGLGFAAARGGPGSGPRDEVPDPFVVVVYTAGVVAVTSVALLGAVAPDQLATVLPALPVGGLGATGIAVALAVGLGVLGYRYAVDVLASYTPH